MRALAWDDEEHEESYMDGVASHLLKLAQIDVEVIHEYESFFPKFRNEGPWDIIITDLYKGDPDSTDSAEPIGYDIAGFVREHDLNIPIFIITNHIDKTLKRPISIPKPTSIKPKWTSPDWTAIDIFTDLINMGAYSDPDKVFLIRCTEDDKDGTADSVETYLENLVEDLIVLGPKEIKYEILNSLVQLMQACSAIVAVCTPDDFIEEYSIYQPRQNVLFEMGVAVGLARGLSKLIVLQKYGNKPEKQAELPSDLRGVLSYRIAGPPKSIFKDLLEHLKKCGTKIKE